MNRSILIATLLFFSAVSVHAAELIVGHYDLQRLVSQSDAGKEAREKYLVKAKSYQDEINSRSEKLKNLKEEVEAGAKKLKENEKPSAQLMEKDKAYEAQYREFQRLLGGYRDELKVYDNELTRKVLEELAPVVSEFAAANKYDYLFRLNETFSYATEKRDITDDLVKVFNKAHRK